MQIDLLVIVMCLRLWLIVECMVIVWMFRVWYVCRMCSVIFFWLVIMILLSMDGFLVDYEQWLVEFDWLVVFVQDGDDGVGDIGFDWVEYFYCFDDGQCFVGFDLLVDGDEGWFVWG